MHSQTKVFSQLVRDHMNTAPLLLGAEGTVADLLACMAEAKSSNALIVEAKGPRAGCLLGIVTEQDVIRRIALRCQGHEPLADVMTVPVRSIGEEDYLYYAIAAMRRFGWRHMPVVDRSGRPVGVIELVTALAVAGETIVRQIDSLCQESSLEGLAAIKADQVSLASSLMADRVPAPDIQNLISHINGDIHRRLLERNLQAMAEEGLGEPPVGFCLLIMGSGGRGENYLYPDQDNGFILDDYPDADHTRIDGFFIDLAERLNRDLAKVGFPLCEGHVMARNPLWRKTRSQWRAQVQLWGKRRNAVAIQHADIFFDFCGAYGEVQWAAELRETVTEMAKASPAFLRGVSEEISGAHVALGWFGHFLTEKSDPDHRGEVNLKYRGTLPLVSNLRLLALAHGVSATGTRERIDQLHDAGVLNNDERDYLAGAFRHITMLLLRQQLADFQDPARKVSNFVRPGKLSARERDMLVDSFDAIDKLAKLVRYEFTGEIF